MSCQARDLAWATYADIQLAPVVSQSTIFQRPMSVYEIIKGKSLEGKLAGLSWRVFNLNDVFTTL